VTTSSGTSTRTQDRLTGGLPARFARPGAPAPGEPVPSPARTSPVGRTARTRLNVDDARCEALFASALQRSDAPSAESVAAAISHAVRRLGIRGCVNRMAQEFGDHPQAAAERMRWVRQLAAAAAAPATCEPGPRPPGRSPGLAVRQAITQPAVSRPARRDHPRQLLTSATSTEGTRHSEADTGPAAPAAPRGQRTAARGIPRPGHPPGPAGHRTRRPEDAITDDLPRR